VALLLDHSLICALLQESCNILFEDYQSSIMEAAVHLNRRDKLLRLCEGVSIELDTAEGNANEEEGMLTGGIP
jgi:hypothetical protein